MSRRITVGPNGGMLPVASVAERLLKLGGCAPDCFSNHSRLERDSEWLERGAPNSSLARQLFHAPPVRKKRKEKKKKRKEKEKKRKRRREKKKRKEGEREENAGAARSAAGLGGQVHLAVRWPTGNFGLFLLFRDSRARG